MKAVYCPTAAVRPGATAGHDREGVNSQLGAVLRNHRKLTSVKCVKAAFRWCRTLMVDGDDTYPAESARALCEPILAGEANMTVGDRLSNGTLYHRSRASFPYRDPRSRIYVPVRALTRYRFYLGLRR